MARAEQLAFRDSLLSGVTDPELGPHALLMTHLADAVAFGVYRPWVGNVLGGESIDLAFIRAADDGDGHRVNAEDVCKAIAVLEHACSPRFADIWG